MPRLLNTAWSLGALANIPKYRLPPRLRSFSRHEAGSVVVLAAILLPIVIGGMGLGAETGYWYLSQRKMQHTADVSAHAGATRKRAGDDETKIRAAAEHIAAASGMAEIVVNNPPTSGAYAGDMDSVEVLISKTQPLLFSSIFMDAPVTIDARAVARFSSDNNSVACVLALSKTASGAVTVSGSTTVNLEGCDVHSNSNAANSFLMSGSGILTTDCVTTVGGAVTTAQLTVNNPDCPKEQSGEIPDPFEMVLEPAVTGTCRSNKVGTPSKATALPNPQTPQENHPSGVLAIRFCDGLDLKGQVTFAPGLYIIQGDVTVNAGEETQLFGDGVTFFITSGGRLRFNGAAQLNLSAPTEGPFKGILFFGDRDDNVTHLVNGASGSTLQGAIYAAGSAIEYKGNSTTSNGCTQLIGNTVTFIGNSTMNSKCEAAGYDDIETGQVVRLVE